MAVKDDYQDFKNALDDLKMNSKPIINFLTILAEEKIQNAPQIVRAIEDRIIEAKGDCILPVLYVLDSIVKNLRSKAYIALFEHKLPVIFASAFNKVDERVRLSMFKLRQTWPPYFSNAVLHNLDTRTHYIDPAWPITARVPDATPSTPTIHINPDFIQRSPTTTTANQPKLPARSDDHARTGNQTAGKSSESTSRDDNYHMIPIDRKEVDPILPKETNGEQQSKTKKEGNCVTNNSKESSTADKTKPAADEINTKDGQVDDDMLFGGSDIDYRDTDLTAQQKATTNTDIDRLVELNSECFLLAEQKFKSKELSSEEYQATLKVLQTFLQSEVQRLTAPPTTTSSVINNNNQVPTTVASNSIFPQTSLQYPSTATTATSTPALSTFPFSGFANDTHSHAMQILAAVSASSSLAVPYNILSYIPPLPPAPPPFPLLPNTFPSSTTSERLSPSIKRPHDEPSTDDLNDDSKRARYDRSSTHNTRSRNFDEENIAPVPSLIDANINTLKKKYLGVIQQLYIGKYQCSLCGLRFSSKQKHLYNHHLDWHFFQNRQATDSQAVLEICRDWYPSLQEWTVHEENLDEQIRKNHQMSSKNRNKKEFGEKSALLIEAVICTAKTNGDMDDDRCYVCHDPFDNYFDDNLEEWCLKDAIRVDDKTYHSICYQDLQSHDLHEKPSTMDSLTLPESLIDETSNQSSDSQLVDNAMAIVNIKSESEDTFDRDSSSLPEESTKPTYTSSMSFVNLVETIFVKKEDLKPIENLESVSKNVKEELLDPGTISEEIPFLSIKPENDCEFLIDRTTDKIEPLSE
ncbi:unnamed protein product [Adineta ricciae]|uniref:CID domain-containing protein n=1 Tax=Adineta ricciae TaxID=249248 RepID=A0A814R5U8_ADIRI|nr:unnamed protein product [Adineta ricciae]